MELHKAFDAITRKMTRRGVDPRLIDEFLDLTRSAGQERTAYVPLDTVSAPDANLILPEISDPAERENLVARGRDLLSRVVVVKLNGGRSTTMGGEVPKGILTAKDGLSYLEIIGRQMEAVQRTWNADVPLVLMNSFFTHKRTIAALEKFSIPVVTFQQSEAPRLVRETFFPLDTGGEADWAPLGHGEIYGSLQRSGLLDAFLADGRRWAFISNLDNLAATLEPWIIGLIDRDQIDFLLEVTDRTENDKKGGTLIVRNRSLDLLEIAQVDPADRQDFMDTERFRVFNTNSLWVDLRSLSEALQSGRLRLPVIQNRKEVGGVGIIQLETAMGAAIGKFRNARGLRVSRARFFPTKRVEDLIVLGSDVCELDARYRLRPAADRPAHLPLRPIVDFDDEFLASALDVNKRFEHPASLSLKNAVRFRVYGSAFIERDVVVEGDVLIDGRNGQDVRIPRGSILRDARLSHQTAVK